VAPAGRDACPLSLLHAADRAPADGVVVSLDVGATLVKSALLGPDGVPRETERRPTGRCDGPDAIVSNVLEAAAARVSAAQQSGLEVRAVGIACCGIVDEVNGVLVYSANLGWRDVPLREMAAERTGLPVGLSHDVRAGGLAEARLGAGRDEQVFLFVPIGTGVGAAIIIRGEPYAGAHWRAGELGHIVVRPGGEACPCGQRGCLETVAGGHAMERRYRQLVEQHLDAPAPAAADALEISRLAADGDRDATIAWTEVVVAIADSLAVAITLFDPSLVVLGGGLGQSGERLFAPLRAALACRLSFQVTPRLVPAALGDVAGCIGAGLLAWDLVGHR
jgi:glucokinase